MCIYLSSHPHIFIPPPTLKNSTSILPLNPTNPTNLYANLSTMEFPKPRPCITVPIDAEFFWVEADETTDFLFGDAYYAYDFYFWVVFLWGWLC